MGGSAPSDVDLALIRAIHAWGGGDLDGLSRGLSPEWRDRLRVLRDVDEIGSPGEARSALLEDHRASIRPDVSRVHKTWFARALRGESPAVRLAVASRVAAPPGRTPRVEASGGAVAGEADPEAVGWALALWTERLVGGGPSLRADPPVVVALAGLAPPQLFRLIKTCGVVKLAFAIARNGPDESLARFATLDRVRFGFFRRHIGTADARLAELAGLDIEVMRQDRRRGLARLGLVTIGRLIAEVEPHRARWAMQHLPYPIAKLTRSLGTMPGGRKSPIAWEAWVLDAAWSRLDREGWTTGRGGSNGGSDVGVEP